MRDDKNWKTATSNPELKALFDASVSVVKNFLAGKEEDNASSHDSLTSSPTKPACKYGSKCYNTDPIHVAKYVHQKKKKKKKKMEMKASVEVEKKPLCKYGRDCYQTNRSHLDIFRHPSPLKEQECKWDGPFFFSLFGCSFDLLLLLLLLRCGTCWFVIVFVFAFVLSLCLSIAGVLIFISLMKMWQVSVPAAAKAMMS